MRTPLLLAGLAALALAGCGSSGSNGITVGAARTYELAGFEPTAPVEAGVPTTVSFAIDQPSGAPLTAYRRGAGPHTGIHLIIVKDDLSTIIHDHPPVGPDGKLSESVTFPSPGRYRVVVDAYPASTPSGQTNFQLFRWITVAGTAPKQSLPPFSPTVQVDGYTIALHGRPKLTAIEPAFLTATVTDRQGRPARFTPWFGALAHAIFFRAGTLDYFHTHVCAPGASGCTSVLGATKVTGSSSTPGKLTVGVLVPVSGTWRLFLQCRVNGHVLTAPFTLTVK
jgi:hypothetical protein